MSSSLSVGLSTVLGTEILAGFIFYLFVAQQTFSYFIKKAEFTPRQCLYLASSVISTIHSAICCLGVYDFFKFERWNNPLIDEPNLLVHILAFGTGYMVAEGFFRVECYLNYDDKIIPRQFDHIAHHIINALFGFTVLFPNPIYLWNPCSIGCGMNFSTIFLEFRLYGKYFKKKRLESIARALFVLSWFLVRLPICFYCVYWYIKYYERIYKELPLQISIAATLYSVVLVVIIQSLWTVQLIRKMVKTLSKSHKS